jgi:hypothetical protein
LQRQVSPRGTGQGQFFKVGLQDLLTDPLGPSQIGAQSGLPAIANVPVGSRESERQQIAGVSDDTGSRQG